MSVDRPRNSGFIALMSAIIISAVLLIVATTGSFTGFFERGNVLDAELKGRSAAAADACVASALLYVVQNPGFTGPVPVPSLNALDACEATIPSSGSIEVHATSNGATTNLRVGYDSTDYSITSWQEVPVF